MYDWRVDVAYLNYFSSCYIHLCLRLAKAKRLLTHLLVQDMPRYVVSSYSLLIAVAYRFAVCLFFFSKIYPEPVCVMQDVIALPNRQATNGSTYVDGVLLFFATKAQNVNIGSRTQQSQPFDIDSNQHVTPKRRSSSSSRFEVEGPLLLTLLPRHR